VLKATIASVLALAAALTVAGCNGKPKDAAPTAAAPAAAPAAAAKMNPLDHPPARPEAAVDVTGIAKADGGKTVFEIFTERSELANKQVTVRGKVVKANAGIMNKDWLHLRDGSGEEGKNDLTITTTTAKPLPNVGDTVLVTGTVAIDKDFSMGYQYPVMIEDATVAIEAAAAK
jgi:hypothetical protein